MGWWLSDEPRSVFIRRGMQPHSPLFYFMPAGPGTGWASGYFFHIAILGFTIVWFESGPRGDRHFFFMDAIGKIAGHAKCLHDLWEAFVFEDGGNMYVPEPLIGDIHFYGIPAFEL